jgi:hypothetical protein
MTNMPEEDKMPEKSEEIMVKEEPKQEVVEPTPVKEEVSKEPIKDDSPKEDIQIKEAQPDEGKETVAEKVETKNIFIAIAVVIGIFAVIIGGFYIYNNITGATVTSIDSLHQRNAEGKLDPDKGYIYNDYSFVYAQDLWWTEMFIGGKWVRTPLHFGPKDVDQLLVGGELHDDFNNGTDVYVAIDPAVNDKHYTLGISELSFNLVKGLNRRAVGSCTVEDEACVDRDIISCDNNPDRLPVIELVIANETKVILNDTCMLIQGQDFEFVKAIERVLYEWYGIIE